MCAFIKIRVTKIFFPVTKSKKDRQIYYQIYKCPLCYYLSIVEVCCCTKCYTEPVAPETSPVYSCYLSKLGIKFESNSNSVYHLLLLPECLPCIVKLRCTR